MNTNNCIIYIATKMTGRDKTEMLDRALDVCAAISKEGMKPISPILEEKIKAEAGILKQEDPETLKQFWKRDKEIIRREAHVVLIDGANLKSFGVEREYALNRWCLWKPTVLLMPEMGIHVGIFEDDYIGSDLAEVVRFIANKWGTRKKRLVWRLNMMRKTLPKWIYYQVLAWR